MQPPPNDGRSGRILVISMVGAAVLLGLFALRYRRPIPAAPVAPTTDSAASTAPSPQ
jgi:MYXO-CTERM domain-containing protein